MLAPHLTLLPRSRLDAHRYGALPRDEDGNSVPVPLRRQVEEVPAQASLASREIDV